MKKVLVGFFLLSIALLMISCVDYKAYDLPKDEDNSAQDELAAEIAKIEEDLAQQEGVVEEVVELPTLSQNNSEESLLGPTDFTIKAKENELIKLKLNIVDADEDPITYTFTSPLNQSGQWKTNYGDAGEYIVTLTANDGKLTTAKKIKVVVDRVNVAPVIEQVSDMTVKEGQTVEVKPKVSDPNKDEVTTTISDPLKSGTFATDHTSAGQYQVTIKANDGELETEQKFALTVLDVNVAPVVENVDDVTIKEGESVSIKPSVSDLDEDEVKVTISDPVGNDGVWQTSYTDHGEYTITLIADDGKERVVKKIKVVVEDVNTPPEIKDITLDVN